MLNNPSLNKTIFCPMTWKMKGNDSADCNHSHHFID